MPDEYKYGVEKCDVVDCGALVNYRAVRDEWIRKLTGDPDHSVFRQIGTMLGNDRVFRTINETRRIAHGGKRPSAALNPLVARFIDQGYVATQALAIRRLMETTRSKNPERQIISLRLLLDDIADQRALITREMYVCHDGLPFDYQPTATRYLEGIPAKAKGGVTVEWIAIDGPDAFFSSERAHKVFDRLSGNTPGARQRDDLILPEVFDRLRAHLERSGYDDFKTFADKYIAHAGDERSRLLAEEARKGFTLDRLSACQRSICEVAAFLYGPLLYIGSYGLLAVPQFNQFEQLDAPWCDPSELRDVREFWDQHTREVEAWDSDVLDKIMGGPA